MSSVSASNPSFSRYVIKSNEDLPEGVNLEGAFAITRDANHKGLLHKLIHVAQKVHRFFTGRNEGDKDLCHGMLIINGSIDRQSIIIAHSVIQGIQTSNYKYKQDPEITELVIYVPKDENLREMLVRYGNQTAFTHENHRSGEITYGEQKPEFSVRDMVMSVFRNGKDYKPSAHTKKRLAYVVADLLKGKQIRDKRKETKSFFCAPYVTLIYQATQIIDAGSFNIEGKSRDVIADEVLGRLNGDLSSLFDDHPLMRLNGRYAMSYNVAMALDEISEVI